MEQERQNEESKQQSTKKPKVNAGSNKAFQKGMKLFLGPISFLLSRPLLLVPLFFLFALTFRLFLAPIWGKNLGGIVGTAIGSFQGATKLPEAIGSGTKDGLSAEDTTVVLNELRETGNLEVLHANIRVSDVYTQGKNYAALLSIQGEAIFSVDLTKAVPVYEKATNTLLLQIPHPKPVLNFDHSSTEIVDEYNPSNATKIATNLWEFFTESAQKGYQGYLNSMEQLRSEALNSLSKDVALIEQAERITKEQVALLASSICGDSIFIQVEFLEDKNLEGNDLEKNDLEENDLEKTGGKES